MDLMEWQGVLAKGEAGQPEPMACLALVLPQTDSLAAMVAPEETAMAVREGTADTEVQAARTMPAGMAATEAKGELE